MKVILVDDEKAGLENLHYYLSKYGNIEILGMYQDPLEALQGIIDQKPDAVFLDIMMPEMSGLEAASEILKFEEGIKIVFVTAFDEYAIKAFEVNAIDYVLKPYSDQRIEMAINRINKLMHENDPVKYKKKHHAIQFEAMQNEIIKIPVWKDERIFLCDPFEISYLSSEDGNVKISISNGETYKSKDTLAYFESRLDSKRFFRCHKSFIINTAKIKEIIPWFNNTYLLKMEGLNEQVPVSRYYIKSFKKLFDL
ncbi:MAG TPA: LytTR family DNA-binding domain-containing protein [Pseudobacteroides sp.]|uniref:LytR/AlgR family response regulator transcription factor n=1 Tax=Pseudobacteroides sp. TaxID=1968840 RepID=UPI002F93487B